MDNAPETPAEDVTLPDAARAYAEYGWYCFPCGQDKRPLTANGFQDATTDRSVIDAWWTKWPKASIGIDCGRSGLVILDYDQGSDPTQEGAVAIAALLDEIEGADTRMARSGSGGTHYYWRARKDVVVRNTAGLLGPGVDTRGEGGYVIAPPSRNERGAYTWLNHAPVRELPASIVTAIQQARKDKDGGPVTNADGVIPLHSRNATLASLAGTLRRKGSSPIAIEKYLLAENAEHCSPPLSEAEVKDIARKISRYPAADPVTTAPDDLAAGPAIELLDADAVRVTLLLKDEIGVSFTFSEMEKERRELNCHVLVSLYGESKPFQQRVNLESNSQRNELRRELDNLYGKQHGWSIALNDVWNEARNAFLNQERGTPVNEIARLIGARDLISPIMPAEGTTMIFSSGGSMKSYLCLGQAVAGQVGMPFAGQYVVPPANCLYIDYEDSEANFRRRTDRILAGLGLHIDRVPGLMYWRARGIPLKDQWDAVKRYCDRHDVGWLIIDSAAAACGGPPEDAQVALAFFSALERIGRPNQTIAHIVKAEGDAATKMPFGSVFFSNYARRTWYVARAGESDANSAQLAMYCRKVNDGARPRPIGIQVDFEGDEGAVRFSASNPARSADLSKHDTLPNQIAAILTSPMTVTDIAERLDVKPDVVSQTLRRYTNLFASRETAPITGRGQPAKLWAQVAREEPMF